MARRKKGSFHGREASSKRKPLPAKTLALIIVGVLLLSLIVRLYYNSGPVYELGDEGVYLNIFSQAIVFKSHPVAFSMYANSNFSDIKASIFNPANIFKFYSGFIYPELLTLAAFGYNAYNAIYYVVFTSLIECLFVFLTIDLVAGRRAAIIGAVLLAFFPLDVMLSVRVVPVVPMAAMLSVAVYLFIRAELSLKPKARNICYLLCGLFIGLAYLTHPEGIILLPFVAIYLIAKAINSSRSAIQQGKYLALVFCGAFIAFSITGIFYLAIANNFFLYPAVDHSVFLYQYATQAHINFTVAKSIVLSYTTGNPLSYVNLMLKYGTSQTLFYVEHNFLYFSIYGYLAVIFGALVMLKARKSKQRLFVYMIAFYLIALSLMPVHAAIFNSKLVLTEVNSNSIYGIILVLPSIVIIASGLDYLMSDKRRWMAALALAIIACGLTASILELNYDSGIYRNSMYDVNAFVAYLNGHGSDIFYAQPAFTQEVQDITGYRYISTVRPIFNCNLSSITNASNDYFVLGGTLSITWAPQVMSGYDACVSANLTDTNTVYQIQNPYQPGMPLQIVRER